MALMTKEQYIESLRKINFNVYMFGKKVENTVDIDPTTPLYPILHNMNCTTPLITSNIEFSTVLYETFIQTADYFYIKERILKQNNEINILIDFIFPFMHIKKYY